MKDGKQRIHGFFCPFCQSGREIGERIFLRDGDGDSIIKDRMVSLPEGILPSEDLAPAENREIERQLFQKA